MMHIVPMPGKINCKSGQRIANFVVADSKEIFSEV